MADPVTAHDTISAEQLAAIVELACRAPSLHNSQPWRWVFDAGTLHLFADHARVGRHTDSTGREVILSCGAALDHLEVAAAAAGWRVTVVEVSQPAGSRPSRGGRISPGRIRGRARTVSWPKRSRVGARIGWRSRHLSHGLRWNSNCARSSMARAPTWT